MAGHWACPACGAVVPDAERHECAGTVWDKAAADRITGVMVATAEWEATQAVVAAAREWSEAEKEYAETWIVRHGALRAALARWSRARDALRAALARLDGAGKEDGR